MLAVARPNTVNSSQTNVFDRYYLTNHWGDSESRSGRGSSTKNAAKFMGWFPRVARLLHIRTVLDLPCGDFNFMQHVTKKNPEIAYIGADVVNQLISDNQKRFPDKVFIQIDAKRDFIPKVDCILCRDLLFHLSNEDVQRVIENILSSDSRYLITNYFEPHDFGPIPVNGDITEGQTRYINLSMEPFGWKPPFIAMKDTRPKLRRKGMYLGVYDLDQIRAGC